MPHLSIEYTANIPEAELHACLEACNGVLAASGHFEERDIKSRTLRLDHYRVGTRPEGRAFVAAKLALLAGRNASAKQELAQRLLEVMRETIPRRHGELQISVELVDIRAEAYTKWCWPAL